MIYVLIAIGYTLIFGILQVIFFAQGELSMVAAFAAVMLFNYFWGGSQNLQMIALVTMVLGGIFFSIVIGLIAERISLRPIRNAPRIKALITSLGMSIVLQNIVMNVFGPQNFLFPIPTNIGNVNILGLSLGY